MNERIPLTRAHATVYSVKTIPEFLRSKNDDADTSYEVSIVIRRTELGPREIARLVEEILNDGLRDEAIEHLVDTLMPDDG